MKLSASAKVFRMPIPYNPKFHTTLDLLAAKYDVDDCISDFCCDLRKIIADFKTEPIFIKIEGVLDQIEKLQEALQADFVVRTRTSSPTDDSTISDMK